MDVPSDIRDESGDIAEDNPAETAELPSELAVLAGFGGSQTTPHRRGSPSPVRKAFNRLRLQNEGESLARFDATFSNSEGSGGSARPRLLLIVNINGHDHSLGLNPGKHH